MKNWATYLPVESPTGDYYGGHRPGKTHGESLVCVDLETGQRKWHYQLVHHPLWDMDISSALLLADINVNGRMIKAVAATAGSFMFDRRRTACLAHYKARREGQRSRRMVRADAAVPDQALGLLAQRCHPDVLIDFMPAMKDQALTIVSK